MRFVERSYERGHWKRLYLLMLDEADQKSEREVFNEMKLWCVDQFGPGGDRCDWNHESGITFLFHNLSFATAFKIKWMSSLYIQQ